MYISYNKATENSLKPFKMAGNWETLSRTLKEKLSKLTDSDLKLEAGKEEELFKRVGSRRDKKREEVIDLIGKGQPGKL